MNELGGYAFADLRVGMCATFAKTVTEADIVLFAAVRRQQRHPHQRGVRGRHHFQGPHCPWNAVGKRNLSAIEGEKPWSHSLLPLPLISQSGRVRKRG